jgi:hypothetical protein
MRQLISGWVSIVLDDIASRGHLRSLQREETTPLIAVQRDYELPTGTDQVFKVFVPAWGFPNGILKKLDHDEFVKKMLEEGVSQTGQPKYYNIFANTTIRLHPMASAVYAPNDPTVDDKLHIFKYRDISHLADGDEITEIKIKHIPTVIFGAYHFGARFDAMGDVGDAQDKYEKGINRLIGDQHNHLDMALQVPYRDLG